MKLKKFVLKEGMNQLLDSDLKALKGGDKKMYMYCHCYGVEEGIEVTNCGQCKELCGDESNVQNCTTVTVPA